MLKVKIMKKNKKLRQLPMVETTDTVKLPSKGVIKVSPAKRPKVSKKETFVPSTKEMRQKKSKIRTVKRTDMRRR